MTKNNLKSTRDKSQLQLRSCRLRWSVAIYLEYKMMESGQLYGSTLVSRKYTCGSLVFSLPNDKRVKALIHLEFDWSHEAMACSNGSERIANSGIYSPKANIDLRRVDTGRPEERVSV